MEQTEIRKVRASIHQQCGNRVKIQQDLGRNKVDIQEGVIQQAYPSVFTVLIDDEFEQNPPQLLSFTSILNMYFIYIFEVGYFLWN